MNKIFKHLNENWIKYAFETLVVVVGILVAFSLSNWNEGRKNAVQEQEVLKLMYDDFQIAIEYSQLLVDRELRELQLLKLALSNDAQVDSLFGLPIEQEVAQIVFWNFQHEAPVFRGYMDLKGSGRSGLIKSQELRAELTELDEEVNELKHMLDDRRTVHSIRIDAIAIEHLNFLPLLDDEGKSVVIGQATDYPELLKDQKIRNMIGVKLQLGTEILKARNELHAQIVKVVQAIEKELI